MVFDELGFDELGFVELGIGVLMNGESGDNATGAQDVVLATIHRAHGLRGEVKLHHYCATLKDLQRYKVVHSAGGEVLTISRVRRGRNEAEAIVSFAEVTNRDQSEALLGQTISVTVDALPPLHQDEFFHRDLIGIQAFDATQQRLGRITAVHNFGAGDVLTIANDDGQEFLHPFKPAFVTDIDLAQKQCVLHGVMDRDDETDRD